MELLRQDLIFDWPQSLSAHVPKLHVRIGELVLPRSTNQSLWFRADDSQVMILSICSFLNCDVTLYFNARDLLLTRLRLRFFST